MSIIAGQTILAADFISSSAGASDSGKVPKLNASGVLDPSFNGGFTIQDVPISTTGFGPSGNLQMCSQINSNSALYYAYCPNTGTSIDINRYQKQISGQYVRTHTTTLTCSSSGLRGIVATSTYLYVYAVIGGVGSIRRYSLADLSGVTSMTFTATTNTQMWSDGTDIYIQAASGTFDRYTISGTTMTNAANVSFTGSGFSSACYCDGTNVWLTDGASGSFTIRKYAKTGGASSASSSVYFMPTAYYNNNGGSANFHFFYGGALSVGLGWGFDMATPTTTSGNFLHLTAINLP